MNSQNMLKTALLLGGMTLLFIGVGRLLGGTGGMVFAFFFAIMMNMGAWWFSDSIALRMNGAHEVSPSQAPQLHEMVERLAGQANMPKPRVYVIDTHQPNAFATGRSPEKGAVAVTTGIMRVLSYEELAGVVAHELAHIQNRDTLISSISATFAGAITILADMARWSLMFGGFGRNNENRSPLGAIVGILLLILAPIAAVIIQMAISRSREFAADERGAHILGDARPLASALQKIEQHARQPHPHVNPATSHMYIINPIHGQAMAGLFRTHPPTEERIRRLQAMRI
jgi:heat shock protein HtpX